MQNAIEYWWMPEIKFDVEQRLPTDDPTSMWGFGAFVLFEWRF